MPLPLMPKATAVWLVDNTSLTFDQIAEFCGLHPLEVKGIADDEIAIGIQGRDPVPDGELTREEIERCVADPKARLNMAASEIPRPKARTSGPKYTPVTKRQDRPNAIMWLLRYHSELSDAQVSRLVGTTKPTINSVRDRTHWNMANLKPIDPVSLGMCSQVELDEAVTKAHKRLRSRERREARERARSDRDTAAATAEKEPVVETAILQRAPVEAAPQEPLEIVTSAQEVDKEAPAEEADHSVESVFGSTPAPAAPEPEPTADVFGTTDRPSEHSGPATDGEGAEVAEDEEESRT
tara:strand:- start:15209 stop:16096 length:888 start_codon:yes stop_codon:yes gene_type:complete